MAFQIALDGPAGSGKSTVGKAVAASLGFTFVDTGAMYRAIALKAIRNKIASDDAPALIAMTQKTSVVLDSREQVFLDKENVTKLIRTPEISKATSEISSIGQVRKLLVDMQRKLAQQKNVVMDGRDVGTVIFPQAFLKIYLTASVEERIVRRMKELKAKGVVMSQKQVKDEIIERDTRDMTRKESPLKVASDAVQLQTDGLTVEQIANRIAEMAKERMS